MYRILCRKAEKYVILAIINSDRQKSPFWLENVLSRQQLLSAMWELHFCSVLAKVHLQVY